MYPLRSWTLMQRIGGEVRGLWLACSLLYPVSLPPPCCAVRRKDWASVITWGPLGPF